MNLRIEKNKVSEEGAKRIGNAIENISRLQKLHLEIDDFENGKKGTKFIAEGIYK